MLRGGLGGAPPVDDLKVIGVDDWAKRRGRVYGILIVDVERHWPTDPLTNRTAETLADWIRQHPTVEIIARDRSTEYARGSAAPGERVVEATLGESGPHYTVVAALSLDGIDRRVERRSARNFVGRCLGLVRSFWLRVGIKYLGNRSSARTCWNKVLTYSHIGI